MSTSDPAHVRMCSAFSNTMGATLSEEIKRGSAPLPSVLMVIEVLACRLREAIHAAQALGIPTETAIATAFPDQEISLADRERMVAALAREETVIRAERKTTAKEVADELMKLAGRAPT